MLQQFEKSYRFDEFRGRKGHDNRHRSCGDCAADRGLKVWKDERFKGNTVGGIADYLIAPNYDYLETPLLCAVEAKRDDFAAGETQYIAEMAACRDNNLRAGHDIELHGIVSNGQGWGFYRLTRAPEVLVSGLFTTNDLPTLLGALDYVCAANILQ